MVKHFGKMSNALIQVYHVAACFMYAFTFYGGCNVQLPMMKIAPGKFDPGPLKYLTIWNVFAYSVYYDTMYVTFPKNVIRSQGVYGGKFKYLTFLDAIIQAVFFFICAVNDFYGTNAVNPKKAPMIRKIKDYIHAVLGFPVAMFVGVTFWALMYVDRELIFPKAIDAFFPAWLNHLMHTMVMVTIVIETILAPRNYPKRSKGIIAHILFVMSYLTWVLIIYTKSGVWVYPVMDVLPLPFFILFLVAMMFGSITLYIVGEKLNSLIWGREYAKHQKSHIKSK